MPARLPRNALPSARHPARTGVVVDHDRRLRAAQENLEHGGSALMAMIYMGHLGVTYSDGAIAAEAREIAAHGAPSEEAMEGFQVRRLFHGIAAQTATAAVDAAAILYAHAVLKSVIDTLCVLSVELDAVAWARKFEERGDTVDSLPADGPSAAALARIEHASLSRKCEALLAVNKRGSHRDVLEEFKYSGDRLKKLDQLCQHLVVRTRFDRKMQEAPEKVDYLLNAAQFFINLLTRRKAESPAGRGAKARRRKKAWPRLEPGCQQGELL